VKAIRLFGGVVAAWCGFASCAWVSAGPVVYDSQSRSIRATLLEEFELSNDVQIDRSAEASARAPDFGDWSAGVTATIDGPPIPPGDNAGTSSIGQGSKLQDAGVTASGTGVRSDADLRRALPRSGGTRRDFVVRSCDVPRGTFVSLGRGKAGMAMGRAAH
jgi:hypothetical protein